MRPCVVDSIAEAQPTKQTAAGCGLGLLKPHIDLKRSLNITICFHDHERRDALIPSMEAEAECLCVDLRV